MFTSALIISTKHIFFSSMIFEYFYTLGLFVHRILTLNSKNRKKRHPNLFFPNLALIFFHTPLNFWVSSSLKKIKITQASRWTCTVAVVHLSPPVVRLQVCRRSACGTAHLFSARAGFQVSAWQVTDAHPVSCSTSSENYNKMFKQIKDTHISIVREHQHILWCFHHSRPSFPLGRDFKTAC